MQITPRERLLHYAQLLQGTLFDLLEAETGPLSEKARLLTGVLEMIPLSRQLPCARGWLGRPVKDRQALASAFVAKSVYGLETTRQLLQRLHTDRQLRCLCGWTSARQIPHESTFSRAFQEFVETELPQRLPEALVVNTQAGRLVGHIARDSTAIEARERFDTLPQPQADCEAQAWSPAQSRTRTLGAAPAASVPTDLAGDAGGTPASLQPRREEEQRRASAILARLQTAPRCGRWADPDLLLANCCFPA
jgi:hypothetical protein